MPSVVVNSSVGSSIVVAQSIAVSFDRVKKLSFCLEALRIWSIAEDVQYGVSNFVSRSVVRVGRMEIENKVVGLSDICFVH